MADRRPGLTFEAEFVAQGLAAVAGLDEAGRGAWAGPVVAGAVILPLIRPDLADALEGVRDSKLCTARQRDALYDLVRKVALHTGIGVATAEEIDEHGIVPATLLAMRRALASLDATPAALLIDGHYMVLKDLPIPQKAMYKGELKSLSIAAASILAKVTRDRVMIHLAEAYPQYGFARHKGYGTPQHLKALAEHGPCPIHRRSFNPIRRTLVDMEAG